MRRRRASTVSIFGAGPRGLRNPPLINQFSIRLFRPLQSLLPFSFLILRLLWLLRIDFDITKYWLSISIFNQSNKRTKRTKLNHKKQTDSKQCFHWRELTQLSVKNVLILLSVMPVCACARALCYGKMFWPESVVPLRWCVQCMQSNTLPYT